MIVNSSKDNRVNYIDFKVMRKSPVGLPNVSSSMSDNMKRQNRLLSQDMLIKGKKVMNSKSPPEGKNNEITFAKDFY